MPNVLIVYHSRTGNTEKMAKAISEGVKKTDTNCTLKSYDETTNQDFLDADGIIIGSPTYFRQMSAELKRVIDVSVDIYGKLKGKIGGVFTSASCREDGEKALVSLYEALDCHGINVFGQGILSIGNPDDEVIERCVEYGIQIANSLKKE
jgi:NAD(P)H dehydrogenase (quinone)